MASKSGYRKKSGSTRSIDAGDKDRLIAEMKDRVAVLENELRLNHDSNSPHAAEGSLQFERLQLLSIFDSIDEVIYVADPYTYEIMYANRAMQDKFGKSLIGGICYREIQNKDAPCEFCTNNIILGNKGMPYRWEFHNPTVNRDFGIVDRIIKWPDGRDVRFEYAMDITERKRAEEALRESEEKYRELVENANSIIIRWDTQGNLTFFNEYAEKLFGYSKNEILDRNVVGTIVPRSESTGRDLAVLMEDVERYPERYKLNVNENMCKNGDRVWIAWTNQAIRDEHGNVVEILSVGNDITERKRVEDENKRLAKIVETSIDGITVQDFDGNVLAWNHGAEAIFGYSSAEAMGSNAFMIIPKDRVEEITALRNDLKHGADIKSIETKRVSKDGRVLDIWLTLSTLKDDQGKPYAFTTIERDITKRKRAEKALIKDRHILTKSQEVARVGNWAWDLQTGEMTGSAENYRIYGYEPGEVKPTREWVLSRVLPEDHAALADFLKASAQDGKRGSIDFRVRMPDGSVGYVNWIVDKAVWDGSGRITRLYGISQDITERKQAEEALRESEERYKLVIDGAQGAIWDWDVPNKRVYFSRQWKELRGLADDEVTDSEEEWSSRIHPGDAPRVRAAVQAHFEGRTQFFAEEYRILCKDGSWKWVSDRGLARRDAAGRVVRMAGSETDITERKRAEEALKAAKAQAELYVDLMGHDINNIHQAALGYLELARDMPRDAREEYLDKATESLQRSTQLINNVRKLQKFQENRMQAHDVDACAVLAGVHKEYAMIPGKTVTLDLNGFMHCHVRADDLLHDVFSNLVGNAVKHTGDQAHVSINLDMLREDGIEYCRVWVDDDGPGISDESKKTLFNRSLKGTPRVRGMGLGLHIVKTLVENYCGRVWAEDRVLGDHTKGARFVVILPAIE